MHLSLKLVNHFNNISFVVKNNIITDIKAPSKDSEYAAFQNELAEYQNTATIVGIKKLLSDADTLSNKQEKQFAKLSALKHDLTTKATKQNVKLKTLTNYGGIFYEYFINTGLDIPNLPVCENLPITFKAFEKFVSLMSTRWSYLNMLIIELHKLLVANGETVITTKQDNGTTKGDSGNKIKIPFSDTLTIKEFWKGDTELELRLIML